MKLIILKNNLKEGLASLVGAIGENSNLPILKHVLLKTLQNKLHISGTNLELGISSTIPGKVLENGAVSVPFATFYNVVSNSDSERLNLTLDKQTLEVTTDSYRAKIQGTDQGEFPIIPQISEEKYHLTISSTLLKEALNEVIGAAHISEIHPEISGVLFDFQVSVLKLVATDSFRLAERSLPSNFWKCVPSEGWRVIVPLRAAQEVLRVFPNEKELHIIIDSNQILFKTEERELISRLIDGRYPDYEQIIPKSIETEIVLNREKFANAIKLVSSFSGKTSDITLRLKEDTKALEIYSTSQAVGENNYIIPSKHKGPGFSEVVFNWRYLLDGLKSHHSTELMLGVNGPQKPAILKSPEESSYFYIVMPLKNN